MNDTTSNTVVPTTSIVIPAKAGIQSRRELDSRTCPERSRRVRGNDRCVTIFFLIIISILFFSHQSFAITTESLDSAVDEVQSAYKAVQDMTASFKQKTLVAVLNKKISNNGTFRWKKPGMLFIEYEGDQPRQYISNNKKLWVYVPGDTQAESYTVSNKTISKETLEFMRGFGDIKRNYRITGWKKLGGSTELTLVPTSANAPYTKLKCLFGADHLLSEVTIFNVAGNQSTYNFSDVRINTGIPDDLFEFKKPKGVKIVSDN